MLKKPLIKKSEKKWCRLQPEIQLNDFIARTFFKLMKVIHCRDEILRSHYPSYNQSSDLYIIYVHIGADHSLQIEEVTMT